jgi:peptidoglycan/LPS O-acetylase OafA/YrhL
MAEHTPPPPDAGRLTELDALRGLAALSVVIHHLLITVPALHIPDAHPQPTPWWPLIFSPLHIFWAGGEAVMFFFVLSGFVLSIPFYGRRVAVAGFIVKRVFRIYVPYAAAVLTALILFAFVGSHRVPGLSAWFNQVWATPITGALVAQHFALLGSFPNGVFDPVLWSLVHEMRISLIFPALMIAVIRFPLLTLSALLAFGFLIPLAPVSWGDFPLTLHYMLMFVVGALLARHRRPLSRWCTSLATPWRIGLVAAGVLAYTYKWWCFPFAKEVHSVVLDDLFATVGAALFVVIAIGWPPVTLALRRRATATLGRVSYSLYLLHAVVLLTLVHLLYPILSLWAIAPIVLVASLALALVNYRVVEAPSNRLGHRVANMLRPRRAEPSTRPSQAA